MKDGREILDELKKTSRRPRSKLKTPKSTIAVIYGCGRHLRKTKTLMEACRIYNDYCLETETELTVDQEAQVFEGIMHGVDYKVYLNEDLTPHVMKQVKELLILGVDISKTFNKEIIQPEDSLHLVDLHIRIKNGESIICQ